MGQGQSMRIVILPKDRRIEPEGEPAPVRLRRHVLEALYDQDLARAYEIYGEAVAAVAASGSDPDPAMERALAEAARDIEQGKADTLKRLKKVRVGRSKRVCRKCLTSLGRKNKVGLCLTCQSARGSSPSVRTVSGGLPTLGKRRR